MATISLTQLTEDERIMLGVGVVLLVTGAAIFMVLFVIQNWKTGVQIEEALQRWAKQNSLRIIRKECRTHFQGPFTWNQYRPVYFVTVEDQHQRQRKAWVRLGWWYIIGFHEQIEAFWDTGG